MKQRQDFIFIASILAVALVFRCVWVLYTQYIGDDAFITFRYAQQLADGNGFTYNLGDPVYGTTTPAFTFLMALWLLLAPEHVTLGAWLFNLAASLASLALLAVMLQRAQMTRSMQLAVLGLLAMSVNVYRMDMSGAETSLVILLMMASWVALDSGKPALAGVLAGCLLWTRLDTIFWVLAFFFFSSPKKALPLGLAAGLTYLPWVVFATLYFGSPIPFTMIAKSVAYATSARDIPGHFVASVAHLSPLRLSFIPAAFLLGAVTLGIALWQAARLRKNRSWLPLPVFVLLELASLTLTGATMFNRYFAPLSWVVWILFASALPLLWQQSRFFKTLPAWVPRALVVAGVLVLFGQGVSRATALRAEQISRNDASLKAVGLWLKASAAESAAESATVLLEPAGYMGYYSQLHILDEVGLVTPQVVDLKRRGLTGDVYFAYLQPDYVVLHCDDALQVQASPPVNGVSFAQDYAKVYVSNPLGFDPAQAAETTDVLARNSCYEVWQVIPPSHP